jgi:hypothetical protein
MYSDPTKYRR